MFIRITEIRDRVLALVIGGLWLRLLLVDLSMDNYLLAVIDSIGILVSLWWLTDVTDDDKQSKDARDWTEEEKKKQQEAYDEFMKAMNKKKRGDNRDRQ